MEVLIIKEVNKKGFPKLSIGKAFVTNSLGRKLIAFGFAEGGEAITKEYVNKSEILRVLCINESQFKSNKNELIQFGMMKKSNRFVMEKSKLIALNRKLNSTTK